MNDHLSTSLGTPAGRDDAAATVIVVHEVRRPKGRVRRVTHAIVPCRLRRRLGRIQDRIQAGMHIATRA